MYRSGAYMSFYCSYLCLFVDRRHLQPAEGASESVAWNWNYHSKELAHSDAGNETGTSVAINCKEKLTQLQVLILISEIIYIYIYNANLKTIN